MEQVQCKSCYWFWGTEFSVDGDFVEVREPREIPCAPGGELVSDGFNIRMCQHWKCFENKQIWNPVHGYNVIKERIHGQGQFNREGRCLLYRKAGIIRKIWNVLKSI